MDTFFYIDGFNLYYGCLRRSPYRWLDISQMCGLALPRHRPAAVKYFTARIGAQPWDPDGDQRVRRQQVYLRALATLPAVSVHLGHFQTSEMWIGLVQPPQMKPPLRLAKGAPTPRLARVVKSEEKGSDVNLAAQLLNDAHLKRFTAAVVVSNDSDLAMPIKLVRDMGYPVGLLSPKKDSGAHLRSVATFVKDLRTGILAASQFPATLSDASGTFTKPQAW